MCTIRERLGGTGSQVVCVLCLPASPYFWISLPQKPECRGRWMDVKVFTGKHPALAPCGLQNGIPETTKINAASVLNLTIFASAAARHGVHSHQLAITPDMSHTLWSSSTGCLKPALTVLPFYQTLFLKHCSRWLSLQPYQNTTDEQTSQGKGNVNIWPVDTVSCSPSSQQVTGQISVSNYCFPILNLDCKIFFRTETTSLSPSV